LTYLAAQFLVFLALAQLTSTTELGRFAWASALTSPIFTLADMRTQQVQLTTNPAEYTYRDFLRQRLITTGFSMTLLLPVGVVVAPDEGTRTTLLAVIALKSVEAFLNVILGEHLRREEMSHVGKLQVIRACAYMLPFVVIAVMTHRADLSVAGGALSLLVPVVLGHRSVPLQFRECSVSQARMWRLTKESVPLGIGFFIGSVTVNAPRFILERYHGIDSLAIFAAVSYVVVVANSIVDSIVQGAMPRLAILWGLANPSGLIKVIRNMCLAVLAVGLVSVAVAYVGGRPILGLVFGVEYSSGRNVLAAMMVCATAQYIASVLRAALIARGMRMGVTFISLVNLVVSLALSVLLVPGHAGLGLAWSLTAGQALAAVVYSVLVVMALRLGRPECDRGTRGPE
jgi:O-antigen/teichoic acid export membrane protein